MDRTSLKGADSFTKTIFGFFDNLFRHYKGAIAFFVIIFALGLGTAVYLNRGELQSQAAKNELYLAEVALEKETKTLAGVKEGPHHHEPGDEQAHAKESAAIEAATFKKVNVDTQFPESIKKLKEVEKNFGRTRAGYEAVSKLGDLYYKHGDFSNARSWYEKALQHAPGNFEKALSLSSMAYMDENLGKADEAIKNFQKAVQYGEAGLKGDLLISIARNYEAIHDTAKARSTYDQILSDLPGTDYAKSAELFKSQL